jgi:hypothetical protein
MDFIEKIKELSAKVTKEIEHIETEEATKNALIMPFINVLGYNVFDPTEVMPEFTADVGTKKGEKVDYAIMKEGKPIMLFECKSVGTKLEIGQASQLFRYFTVTPAKIGVLTDGIIYQFYSDLEQKNLMDNKPFLEFNILKLQEASVEELKKFKKDSFVAEAITEAAFEMRYTKEIKRILNDELNAPSEEFVKYFISTRGVYGGSRVSSNMLKNFTRITQNAFTHFIADKRDEFLESAKELQDKIKKEIEQKEDGQITEKIITTEEELEAYYITRAILSENIPVDRVALKDYQSYCNILLDNKITQPLLRLHFNGKQWHIGLFDENKKETRFLIEKLSDIYKYKEQIKKAAINYDSGKKSSPTTP